MCMVCWLKCGASVYVSVRVRVSVSMFVSEFGDLCVELMVSILCWQVCCTSVYVRVCIFASEFEDVPAELELFMLCGYVCRLSVCCVETCVICLCLSVWYARRL